MNLNCVPKKINSCRSSSKLVNSLYKQKLDNKKYYDVRFKERLKLATTEFQSSISKRNNGSNGSPALSLNEIISKHNFFLKCSKKINKVNRPSICQSRVSRIVSYSIRSFKQNTFDVSKGNGPALQDDAEFHRYVIQFL